MTSKENYANLNATKLVNKINDLTIGEDVNDYLAVNSTARFFNGAEFGTSTIKISTSDNTADGNFIEIEEED